MCVVWDGMCGGVVEGVSQIVKSISLNFPAGKIFFEISDGLVPVRRRNTAIHDAHMIESVLLLARGSKTNAISERALEVQK